MTAQAYTVAQANGFLNENFAPWVLDLKPIVTKVDGGTIELEMPPNERLHRAGQIVCGQALMAIADTAMVIGLVSALEQRKWVTTVDMNTAFMRPLADDTLVARTDLVKLGRSMAFMRVTMTAKATGKSVSHAAGTYAVLGNT